MMQFYDIDSGGSLSYEEFLKFILPCDDQPLREEACQRNTTAEKAVNGKRLHPTVETAMAEYFEQEIAFHI